MTKKKKIKIGIFGAGKMALWHLRAYRRNPDAEIIGICNPASDKGLILAKKFGIPNVFKKEEELFSLAGLDGVDICVPTALHKDLICKAVRHNLNVYTEKPMCSTFEEANEIVELNKQHKKIILTGFNLRFCREFIKIKNIIESGELGDIRFIIIIRGTVLASGSYMFDSKLNSGIINEFGCHFIDLLRFWGYKDIKQVYTEGSTVFGKEPSPDSVCLNLKFKDGTSAVIINTNALPTLTPEIKILGSKKALTLKLGKIIIQKLPKKWSISHYLWITLKESVIFPYRILYNPFKGICNHFIECIKNNEFSPCNEEEGMENVRTTELLRESYIQNKIIPL